MPAFDFQSYITDIPDYPKPGVIFKDVTTLFKDPEGFTAAIDAIAEHFEGKGITKVVGAEARGQSAARPPWKPLPMALNFHSPLCLYNSPTTTAVSMEKSSPRS